jgi:hypothetical protein
MEAKRSSSVDFSAIRGRADSTPVPTNADPVARARESARMSTPRPSAQQRAREVLAGQLRSELRQWNEEGPKSEWAARLSVEGQILQAFAKGQDRLDLPSEYSDIQFPTNLSESFGITVFVSAPDSLPVPASQVSMPPADVCNEKSALEKRIANLETINDIGAIEAECKSILEDVDKKIGTDDDKLHLYWQMAGRVNKRACEIYPSDVNQGLAFAGKIFVQQLHDRTVELGAPTPNSTSDGISRRLFSAMEIPIEKFLKFRP